MKYLKKAERAARLKKTKESYRAMFVRCEHPNCREFKYYGAIGVSVCERWRIFENFLADLGLRPPGKTLGRRLDTGNYEPGNAWWQTSAEQGRQKFLKNYLAKHGGQKVA